VLGLGIGGGCGPGARPAGVREGSSEAADTGWPLFDEMDVPEVTLVVDGRLLLDGDHLAIDTPPAGWPAGRALHLALTHRGAEPLTLSDRPEDWVEAAGWSFVGAPPSRLGPGETAALVLSVSAAEAAPGPLLATLTVPTPGGPTLHLDGEVPPAMRVVIAEDDGHLLISDDNGWSFERAEAAYSGAPTALVAGGGRWLLAVAAGPTEGRYLWSEEGADWTEAEAALAPPAAACAWALGRFVCAREDSLSWSDSGERVVHVAAGVEPALRGIAGGEGAILGVGEAGRICRSDVAEAWRSEARFPMGEDFTDLAGAQRGDGSQVHLATAGRDQQRALRSTDLGRTWAEAALCGGRGARLTRVISAGQRVLAAGEGEGCPNLHRSEDAGQSWTAASAPEGALRLLGASAGAFFALLTDSEGNKRLIRSEDGELWTTVMPLDAEDEPRFAAQEPWG
jgi:hypothetical protein